MGMITAVPFDAESEQIKDYTQNYWNKRAESFCDIRHEELHSDQSGYWLNELGRNMRIHAGLRILDVGCGTAFFEALLAPFGCHVTGIDLTEGMIKRGRYFLGRHEISAKLLVMDAEELAFDDGAFDVVLSRNLTWNLPHPEKAYREWHRVLRPGGLLINFDAEYAKNFHRYDQDTNKAHATLDDALIEECHQLYHMLSMSAIDRPAWDVEVLEKIGFHKITTDMDVSDRIYREENQFYVPDRMFSIRAVK